MKSLIVLALIAAAMGAIALPLAASSSVPGFESRFESERTIVVAQRPCPNRRC